MNVNNSIYKILITLVILVVIYYIDMLDSMYHNNAREVKQNPQLEVKQNPHPQLEVKQNPHPHPQLEVKQNPQSIINQQPSSQQLSSSSSIQVVAPPPPSNMYPVTYPLYPQPTTYPINYDILRDYDYNKITDVLESPVRRNDRSQIPTMLLRRQIDLATRGYPDNFTQQGTLISVSQKNPDNKLIRLFGRQEFPGSNRYEYYTMISSGNDLIKVGLDNKNGRELYCGDKIFIKELNDEYEVKLFKYDAPKYYPDII